MPKDGGRSYQPENIGGSKVADVLGGGQELPLFGVDDGKRGPEPIGFNNRQVESTPLERAKVTPDSARSPRYDGGGAPEPRVGAYESQMQEQAASAPQGGPQ